MFPQNTVKLTKVRWTIYGPFKRISFLVDAVYIFLAQVVFWGWKSFFDIRTCICLSHVCLADALWKVDEISCFSWQAQCRNAMRMVWFSFKTLILKTSQTVQVLEYV